MDLPSCMSSAGIWVSVPHVFVCMVVRPVILLRPKSATCSTLSVQSEHERLQLFQMLQHVALRNAYGTLLLVNSQPVHQEQHAAVVVQRTYANRF